MPGRSPVNFLTQTIIFIIIALFVLPGVSAYAAEVTLQWDQPDDDRVKGYYIYYGKASESSYDFESADPNITIEDPETTSTELSDLEAGEDYEVAATSFDEDGNESEFSDVVTFTAPEDEDESDEDTSGDDTTSDDENNDSSSSDDESNTDSDTEDQEQDTTDENTDQETNDSQDESDEDSSGDDTTSDDENNDSSSSDDESNTDS
ncbi:MAG: fibronectin type III domain-containing protein, partial [Desulfosalsimonas sp.]